MRHVVSKRARSSVPVTPRRENLGSYTGTYATYALKATGTVFNVANQMGYASIKAMKPYQHQVTDQLLVAINERNAARSVAPGTDHTFGHTNRTERDDVRDQGSVSFTPMHRSP